jgi:rhodanese-related sulfurtransferase
VVPRTRSHCRINIDPQQAHRAVTDGAVLVDVRETHEWHAGHAPDAIHLPLLQIALRHRELPRDGRLVVVCRSGNRSAEAVRWLRQLGYEAFNLAGGMNAWATQGLPVVTGHGAAGQVA